MTVAVNTFKEQKKKSWSNSFMSKLYVLVKNKGEKIMNKKIELDLFGGRIDCIKFALNTTIEMFKRNNQDAMTQIYRDMLKEVSDKELTAENIDDV